MNKLKNRLTGATLSVALMVGGGVAGVALASTPASAASVQTVSVGTISHDVSRAKEVAKSSGLSNSPLIKKSRAAAGKHIGPKTKAAIKMFILLVLVGMPIAVVKAAIAAVKSGFAVFKLWFATVPAWLKAAVGGISLAKIFHVLKSMLGVG